jgi:hypothetical protein
MVAHEPHVNACGGLSECAFRSVLGSKALFSCAAQSNPLNVGTSAPLRIADLPSPQISSHTCTCSADDDVAPQHFGMPIEAVTFTQLIQ